jgi:hypothetical protein
MQDKFIIRLGKALWDAIVMLSICVIIFWCGVTYARYQMKDSENQRLKRERSYLMHKLGIDFPKEQE